MVLLRAEYLGNKKCSVTHPEGATLRTDAPRDIGGEASACSPTDCVAVALATCILTTCAMFAERHGLSLAGARATVEKHMTTPPAPRRIGRLPVVVMLPASIPAEWRERLERAGNSCPVHASLHPEVDAPITYHYV